MPQLPSGLRLAVDTGLLGGLCADAEAGLGGRIPELMAIAGTADLEPYMQFVWMEPDDSGAGKETALLPYSMPMEGPMKTVFSGYRVADWEEFAATLSEEDAAVALEFVNSDRHQRLREELLGEVQAVQKFLLEHETPIVRIQAQWARLGVHPLQTGENDQGMWEGAFDAPLPPEDDFEGLPTEQEESPSPAQGHGDHWGAVGLSGQGILDLVDAVLERASVGTDFLPPWEGDPMHRCFFCVTDDPDLAISVIVGQTAPDAAGEVLSGYPLPRRTTPWTVRIDALGDLYGAFEGVVEGSAPDRGSLQWFAPWFGQEVTEWRQCIAAGEASVEFAGLALGMELYAAEPIVIKQGPAVDIRREELRAEGRNAEANDPDLSVTFITSTMRSLFSSREDHCEYVGKILFVDDVSVEGLPAGWWVQLECLPEDGSESSKSLPVFVFPPALIDGYVPKQGDLVSGVLWLQGSKPIPTEPTLQ